jgi:hypothetical protein
VCVPVRTMHTTMHCAYYYALARTHCDTRGSTSTRAHKHWHAHEARVCACQCIVVRIVVRITCNLKYILVVVRAAYRDVRVRGTVCNLKCQCVCTCLLWLITCNRLLQYYVIIMWGPECPHYTCSGLIIYYHAKGPGLSHCFLGEQIFILK